MEASSSRRGAIEAASELEGTRVSNVTIQDVYYHKSFTANLLGMIRLVKQGWILHASKSEAYIVTPGGNKVLLSCRTMLQPCRAWKA